MAICWQHIRDWKSQCFFRLRRLMSLFSALRRWKYWWKHRLRIKRETFVRSYSILFMWLLPDVNFLSTPTLFTIANSNCPSRIQSPYTWRWRYYGNRLSVRVRSTWLACRHPLHPIYLIPPGPKSVVWEDLSLGTQSLYFKPRAPYIGKLRVGLFLSFYWNPCCFFSPKRLFIFSSCGQLSFAFCEQDTLRVSLLFLCVGGRSIRITSSDSIQT